jgi:hypothetical protein
MNQIAKPTAGEPGKIFGIIPIPRKSILEDMIEEGFVIGKNIDKCMVKCLLPKGWGFLYIFDNGKIIDINILNSWQCARWNIKWWDDEAYIIESEWAYRDLEYDKKTGIYTDPYPDSL